MTKAKKWIISFFITTFSILLVCIITIIAVDPFLYYRFSKYPMMSNIFFQSAGMIRHYEYDTVLLGSSMALHFNPEVIDNALTAKTLKICENGMNATEYKQLFNACISEGKAKHYIICVDMAYYKYVTPDESKYPDYLLDDNVLNDFKYWLNFDAWVKYLPLDAAITAKSFMGQSSELAQDSYNKIGVINSTDGYNRTAALNKFVAEEPATEKNVTPESEAMQSNFDDMIDNTLSKADKDISITLFLPPMSVLSWDLYNCSGTIDYYMEMREHIAEKVSEYSNIELFDFQSYDGITNIDLYKDFIHYNYTINDFMSKEFASDTYLITDVSEIKKNNNTIMSLITKFRNDNPELYESK